MLTPLLAKLRTRFPEAEIAMTVARACAPLYADRPYGVRALGWDPRDAASVRRLLRETGFDLALIPGDNRHSWLAQAMGPFGSLLCWTGLPAFLIRRGARRQLAAHLRRHPGNP